ncbi:hypothetical protein TNCV_4446591 [Trichonephila clavipes]|nr:hypothetical protein TNCV_4446591 [Trichonephila clavipes]
MEPRYSRPYRPGIDVNLYATKKSVAQGMMDIALLTANASQLKYILKEVLVECFVAVRTMSQQYDFAEPTAFIKDMQGFMAVRHISCTPPSVTILTSNEIGIVSFFSLSLDTSTVGICVQADSRFIS